MPATPDTTLVIPDKFIDVDFPTDPKYTFGNAGTRFLERMSSPRFEDVADIIPEKDWPDIVEHIEKEKAGLEHLITRIYDQGAEGSCVANAAAQAHEIIQAFQFGKEMVVHLSAISLYDRIGSSANSGAMVDDGLEEMIENGIVPLDTPENKARFPLTMPARGFSRRMPDGWKDTAKLFAGTEWTECKSRAEMVTASLKGFPICVGRAGHSICYCRPVYKNGKLSFMYVNSWNGWGFGAGDFDTGFGLDSESLLRRSAGWCYALRTVRDWRAAA
jgi:hypothetical protein